MTGTENTIQGTIGEGAKGVETEAQTMAEGLISPDHLNEKEAEIWGMLNQKLKPVQLEVCIIVPRVKAKTLFPHTQPHTQPHSPLFPPQFLVILRSTGPQYYFKANRNM